MLATCSGSVRARVCGYSTRSSTVYPISKATIANAPARRIARASGYHRARPDASSRRPVRAVRRLASCAIASIIGRGARRSITVGRIDAGRNGRTPSADGSIWRSTSGIASKSNAPCRDCNDLLSPSDVGFRRRISTCRGGCPKMRWLRAEMSFSRPAPSRSPRSGRRSIPDRPTTAPGRRRFPPARAPPPTSPNAKSSPAA